MRVLLQCPGCNATRQTLCVPGCSPDRHGEGCLNADFDAALDCLPGRGCCGQDHHHGQAANACPGEHDGAVCPHPAGACGIWASAQALQPAAAQAADAGCPGGHCGKGVPGCTVCRPITITVLDLGLPVGA